MPREKQTHVNSTRAPSAHGGRASAVKPTTTDAPPVRALIGPAVDLICHVQRLGPEYDTGYVHFSLNLSVALSNWEQLPGEADALNYLAPWRWGWNSLRVVGLRADDGVRQGDVGHEIVRD